MIAALIGSGTMSGEGIDYSWSWAAGGILSVPVLLMLLFRRRYPRWWFDWPQPHAIPRACEGVRPVDRDEYPATDEEQAVHLELDYPNVARLNRGLPLVKWLLALPH